MIKEFKEENIQEVMKIWLKTNIDAHYFIPEDHWNGLYHLVENLLPKADIYLYKIENNICGFIGINNNYIEGLFISSSYQSNGYGKELLNYVKSFKNELTLKVYFQNQSAINFYLREGFTIIDESMDENTQELELTMKWIKSIE